MRRIADFREKHAVLLHDLKPSDEREAIVDNNIVNLLKNRDHKNRRILLVNCGKLWDPSKVTCDQLFRVFYLIHLMALDEPEAQVSNDAFRDIMFLSELSGLRLQEKERESISV